MLNIKIRNRDFTALTGKITTDSYSTTIKKLALLQAKTFAQIVPQRLCAGMRHIASALESTFSAFENKSNFVQKPELEFLIRFFGEKQLARALEKARFGNGEAIVLVAKGNAMRAKKIIAGLGFSENRHIALGGNKNELMEIYRISDEELDTVSCNHNPIEGIVIEKNAFVALER